MAMRIENLSSSTVLLRFLSGATLHLRAGETSEDLQAADVKGNPRIDVLVERGVVRVVEDGGDAADDQRTRSLSASKRARSGRRRASSAPKRMGAPAGAAKATARDARSSDDTPKGR